MLNPGTRARVTGDIRAGVTGEVAVSGQRYLAHPFDRADAFLKGDSVVVVEYEPPRTVYVAEGL